MRSVIFVLALCASGCYLSHERAASACDDSIVVAPTGDARSVPISDEEMVGRFRLYNDAVEPQGIIIVRIALEGLFRYHSPARLRVMTGVDTPETLLFESTISAGGEVLPETVYPLSDGVDPGGHLDVFVLVETDGLEPSMTMRVVVTSVLFGNPFNPGETCAEPVVGPTIMFTRAAPDPDIYFFCGDVPGPYTVEEVGYSGCCAREGHGFRRVARREDLSPAMLLIGESDDTIFYLGADGRRHVFPRADILASWYHVPGDPGSLRDDGAICANVVQVPDAVLATIPLSGVNMTFRPGSVWAYGIWNPLEGYVISSGAVLRLSEASFPDDDLTCLDDGRPEIAYPILDHKFANYTIGEPVVDGGDFDPCAAWETTIEEELARRL